jgi:hypothetical protein
MVGPRVSEVFRSEGWVGSEEVGFAGAQASGLNQKPDGDASSDDTGLAATNIRAALDSRKGIPQILDDPLEKLRLLGTAHFSEELLSSFQLRHEETIAAVLYRGPTWHRPATPAPQPRWCILTATTTEASDDA